MFRDKVQVPSSRTQISETIFCFLSTFFDTISEEGADRVNGNFGDKLTVALQQDRRTKISATPMITEILRVCRGLHFHGDSVRIALTGEKLNKKM
jgi:hypothetical protein